jgi:hypothetical protein
MRRLIIVLCTLAALGGSARAAGALTIRDIIELARAGLGEDVILALIEVDRGVYPIDAATLKQLKAAGVGDRVLVALVRSGREAPPVPEPPPQQQEMVGEAPAPQVVVVDHRDSDERVREVPVPVAVPIYVPIHPRARHRYPGASIGTYDASEFVPFQSGPPAVRPEPKPQPVYWGWGGKRRPDSWDPAPGEVRPPDRRR